MVIVPFPTQGYLNQFLYLSRLVSSYNIPIHYVDFSTETSHIKDRIHSYNLAVAAKY